MFKFLFGRNKATPQTVIETQRETITRALDELNAVLALMADRPKVGVDLNSGQITIDLPEQMPDEALALPSPEVAAEVEDAPAEENTADTPSEDAMEKVEKAVKDIAEK